MMKRNIQHILFTLLLLVAGGSEVWGQTTDYSGTYYIKNVSDNKQSPGDYYLCPTEGWAFYVADNSVTGTDNEKPFLTTYHCKNGIYDKTKAVWTIEKAPAPNSDYYYIRQIKTGRYMVSNGTMSGNANRMRVHLESVAPEDLDDKELFSIAPYSTYLVIMPKASSGWNGGYKWYTVNKGNKDDLAGTNAQQDGPASFPNTGGIVGVYSIDDANAKWELENAGPIITNNFDGTVTITAEEGATIYYTTNGDEPTTSSSTYSTPITLTKDMTVIKAISKTEGDVLSTTVTTYDIPVCARPAISVSGGNVTITCNIAGATIYYTIDDTPATPSSTVYTGPFAKGDISIIRAVATKAGYVISSEAILLPPTEVSSSSQITNMNGSYILASNFTSSGSIGTADNPFKGIINGNLNTLTLNYPLVAYADGATIKNVILNNVNISSSNDNDYGNAGAICCEATGDTRIYNCGVLSGSVGGGNNVGGIVGLLDGTARVINCYSFANITGGTNVAGIVGNNNQTSSQTALKTIVVNCMFYGNITGGTSVYPVYGGKSINNDSDTGINPYCYFRKNATLTPNDYNRSWPAEEKNLTRFEYYRSVLNSNRKLCTWWVNGTSGTAPTDEDVNNVGIAKWVLDPGVAPYPILKKWGKYPSVINLDPDKVWDPRTEVKEGDVVTPVTPHWVQRSDANEWEGKSYGTLAVTINAGAHGSGSTLRNIAITDMDTLNCDYSYYKIQLPYYNEVFGNPNGDTHAAKYGGNYTEYVVTGWEITAAGSTTATDYNFADRNSINGRVFAQGGYYYVPKDVTSITITARWGKAIYLSNRGYSIDRVNVTKADYKADNAFAPAGTVPNTFQEQPVYDDLQNAIKALGTNTDSPTVYDQAIVLIGNHQVKNGNNDVGYNLDSKWHPFTIMSADFDFDNEPDYSLQFQFRVNTPRPGIQPIRFDFLPVVELGLALRHDNKAYAIGIFVPQGHFEVTETAFMRTTQFEYDGFQSYTDRRIEAKSPVIINGGEYEMFVVRYHDSDRTSYFLLGGNAWIHRFAPGAHPSNATPKIYLCPINVIGGQVKELYLTGLYRPELPAPTNQGAPRCYTDGGKFDIMAGAGYDKVEAGSNVTFKINHSKITEFYGGGINGTNPISGNIDVTINNSYVDKYCGGPKVGDMTGKTVTTNATGTIFGVFFGGGNGGNSYYRQLQKDGDQNSNHIGTWTDQGYNWDGFNPLGVKDDGTDNKGYHAEYEFEVFNHSNGVTDQITQRGFIRWIQFGITKTGNVTSTLSDCKVLGNFYGGGNLATVDGNVTSTLTNTQVAGSVFGAGYSAAIPTFQVHDKNQVTFPSIAAGVITDGHIGYDDKVYEWTNEILEGKDQAYMKAHPAFEKDGKWYCYTWNSLDDLGAVTGSSTLTIDGNTTLTEGKVMTVLHSVYGGGEESVVNGNTIVSVTGGTIGTEDKGGATYGNVYGGGKGKADDVNAGLVKGNTNVTISGSPAILHNVYGGGAFGSVGTFTDFDAKGFPNALTANTGTANVTITGGTFGSDGKNNGMVFGSSRGSEGDPEAADSYVNKIAWVGNTNVVIGTTEAESNANPAIKGSVYGGGENGHNYQNGHVTVHSGTIGITDSEIDGGARYPTRGNVYGSGCGTDTFNRGEGDDKKTYYDFNAGIVLGNTQVDIDGGHIVHNVYGGGAMGTVGTYTLADEAYHTAHPDVPVGKPLSCAANTGTCTINITGGKIGMTNATMTGHGNDGPDDFGHVFGAGRGTSKDPEQYPNVEHCAFFNNTQLTIGGTALVCGSIYGGSESGHVMNNTNVTISGGQIGCGEGRTTAYSDSDFESETLPGTAHWTYVAEGAPYDQYANDQAQYPDGSSSEGGKPVATDGRTFYGNVFAGGSGYYPYAPGKWLRSAGHTGGTATVTVTGGHILNHLYGGSEMADIDGAVTVNVNGGTVGVPRTKEQYLANPNYGYVFGGGMGDKRVFFNTRTNVSSTTVNITNGTVFGSVYGGGEDGHVLHDAAVTITPGENTVKIGCDGKSGYDGNVFGGGQGSETAQTAGVISGDVRVRIEGGTMSGSVYGGGRLASVGTYLVPADNANYGKLIPDDWEQVVDDEGIETDVEDPGRKHGEITLTVNGGTIKGSVFGAGKGDRRTKFNTWTNVKSTSVTVTSANIGGSVFGGGEDGHVLRDAVTQINPATGKTIVIGADDGEDNGNVFGGGQGSTTALTAGVVSGNVTLDIKGGTMWGSVYGGGRLAAVGTFLVPPTSEKYGTFIPDDKEQIVINDGPGNTEDAPGRKHGNITVSLTGGTIHGDVFGGGMGTLDDEHGTAAILGISKNVQLDLNEGVETTGVKGCVVLGNIFGCNNMNASPKGTVNVHIHATQNDLATQIQNDGEVTNAKVDGRYDVKAVYGGGNMAAYVPEDLSNGTTNVTIDGCQFTSIQQVYGGGNAASTPATCVTVNGTYEIEEVFGGGNGKDDIVISGETKPNPGANVGFYAYDDDAPDAQTPADRAANYGYGTGDASVNIFGGTIHRVFGGSNTKGNVKTTAVTMLDENSGCDFCVDEAYGGGKSAPMDAEAKLLMACIPGLQAVYGGAEAADVHGDVTLNITNGTFKRVFGGNNISGTIDGAIKVNIEEVGCRPIIIGELYGGGNKAAYSIYGYNDDGTPKTSGENPKDDPQVNLKAFTSIGAVYGGGYGTTATMVGSPTVSINEVVGTPTTYPTSGTDGSIGGTFTEDGYSGATGVVVDPETGHTVDIPAHERGKIGAVGKVFGGGNAAKVMGSTTVNVGNLSTVDFEATGAGEVTPRTGVTVIGADIKGNVYGGGDAAEVTGDASVNVGKRKVVAPEPEPEP